MARAARHAVILFRAIEEEPGIARRGSGLEATLGAVEVAGAGDATALVLDPSLQVSDPPAIILKSYNSVSRQVALFDVKKITEIPFPFPYAQVA